MTSKAQAHPNIALIKYWGKAAEPGNIPATPSLSITLNNLTTTTSVAAVTGSADKISLNGVEVQDTKIQQWLLALRAECQIPHLAVTSRNNFPTASGLASSASGFAALITAINAECTLGLDAAQCSQWARRGSASAARSVFGGWVTLDGPHWQGQALDSQWALDVIVAITQTAAKSVSSSAGMALSKDHSPFFDQWTNSTKADFATAQGLVANQDFAGLAELAETSCLKMHGLMLATPPGLIYWRPATLAVIHEVRRLRDTGLDVFLPWTPGLKSKPCADRSTPNKYAPHWPKYLG